VLLSHPSLVGWAAHTLYPLFSGFREKMNPRNQPRIFRSEQCGWTLSFNYPLLYPWRILLSHRLREPGTPSKIFQTYVLGSETTEDVDTSSCFCGWHSHGSRLMGTCPRVATPFEEAGKPMLVSSPRCQMCTERGELQIRIEWFSLPRSSFHCSLLP
jgi:hypothetical protein